MTPSKTAKNKQTAVCQHGQINVLKLHNRRDRIVLIVFSVILQTIITAQMLSTGVAMKTLQNFINSKFQINYSCAVHAATVNN